MIDNNGIFKISDPNSKIDRIKIDTKNLKVRTSLIQEL